MKVREGARESWGEFGVGKVGKGCEEGGKEGGEEGVVVR